VTKKNKKKRARYTEQFKAEVLRAVETRGSRTIAEVAESLGVPEHGIHDWKRAQRESGTTTSDRGETMEQENVSASRGRVADGLVRSQLCLHGEGSGMGTACEGVEGERGAVAGVLRRSRILGAAASVVVEPLAAQWVAQERRLDGEAGAGRDAA